MPEQISNNPISPTTLASNITSTSATSLSVTSGTGYPATGSFRIQIDSEVMDVTGVSGTTWTITRGSEGTTAATHSSGATVYIVMTAAAFIAMRADTNQIGTRANLPSTTGQLAGNRYKCTDSPYEFIFDGTKWQAFIFGYHVDEPVSSNFSWLNQGTSTLTTTNGGMLLKVPPNSGDSLRVQYQANLSAPYTYDIGFTASMLSSNYTLAGICVLPSSPTTSTKLLSIDMFEPNIGNTGCPISIAGTQWTNVTTSGSSITTAYGSSNGWPITGTLGPLFWIRLYDDATNFNFYFSQDGIVFNLIYQASRTAWLTPANVGFFVDQNNSTTNTWSLMWAVHSNLYSGAPPTTGYTVS